MPTLENILFASGLMILLSAFFSKIADRYGIPILLLFLVLGMLAGSEGIGGIYFNNAFAAKSLGVVALFFILFSGGFDTPIKNIRYILVPGIALSTLGVLLTAIFVGFAAVSWLNFTPEEGFLLGAIVSCTDAAAVFSTLRSQKSSLKGQIGPLIELESGSNDPMAVFLTVSILHYMKHTSLTMMDFFLSFLMSLGLGFLIGWLFGRGIVIIINRVKLAYEGLYPALLFSLVVLAYTSADWVGGNGFLSVYIAGIISGNANLIHKKTLKHFMEGFAWLMQIVMFLTLGLLVFPSHIVPIIGIGLLISLFLIFIARPLSVWICLIFTKFSWQEKTMISWAGLRGAVPIILATFPLLAGIPKADMIFNIVFFIVLTSILIQGAGLPFLAQWLQVSVPVNKKKLTPIHISDRTLIDAQMEEVIVPYNSTAAKRSIVEIGFPAKSLIVLVCRQEQFFIPNGATVIDEGDILWILADKMDLKRVYKLLRSD